MQIQTFYFNPYRECTYLIENGQQCVVIDPGMYGEREQQRLTDYLNKKQLTPVAVLITHTHPDHICGLEYLQQQYPQIPIYGKIYQAAPAELLGYALTVLDTPGHKEDSQCFWFPQEQTLFTGDTLFQESIGRTDLPGGDMDTLFQSLRRLAELPKETQVYPGHGYPTTIGHEIEYNPYL